jgi:hypothetical protein
MSTMMEHRPDYINTRYCATCKMVYPVNYRYCEGWPEEQISGCGALLRIYPRSKEAKARRLRTVKRY